MKKFLAALLALVMIASCVSITAAADEPVWNIVTWANGDTDAGWSGAGTFAIDTEDKKEGAGAASYTLSGTLSNAGAMMIMYQNAKTDVPSINIKGMRYLQFDLYVSNAAAFKDVSLCLELTSGGTCDKEENQWITPMDSYVEGGLKDGWNRAQISLDVFAVGTGTDKAPLNVEALNYLRLFNVGALEAGDGLTIKLDNVRFWDGVDPTYVDPYEHETYKFMVFDASEEEYMIHTNAGKNDQKRFSDKNLDTTYKYTVKNGKLAEKVEWTAKVGSQLLLLLSHDGENWTEFYRWNGTLKADGSGGMDAATVTYDLTEYVDFSKSNDLYIRVADSFPETGWGGNIYTGVEVVLDLLIPKMDDAQKDAIEAEADDRSISLMTCSTPFGAFKLDKENKTAGASSLVMNVGGGPAPSTTFATPVDGTGYDALEFELYVSDLALFDVKFGNTQLELTSSGQCDQEEIGWNLATIKDCIVGEPQVGWNHVVLYMSEAATRGDNPFDISRINFFRFFMVQPKDADGNAINVDINVGIDNLRLTKAGAERDAQIAAENQAAADKVIERIDKIGTVDLDSINAIEKAEEEYNELTRAQKELVTNYDVLTAARAKYDELKAAADAEANKPAEDENKPSDETTGEDEKPVDENKPTDEKPVDEEGGSNVVIIIVIVAVVVVAAVVVVIILAKKKKK